MNKKQVPILEQKIINLISIFLIIPHNYNLLAMISMFWIYSCYFSYNANHNFDRITTLQSYIIYCSSARIAIGMLCRREFSGHITRLSLLTQILAIFALLTMKQLDEITYVFAIYILVPLSMFCFLLLIKNIWLASMAGEESDK
jgi:hypothetical protein